MTDLGTKMLAWASEVTGYSARGGSLRPDLDWRDMGEVLTALHSRGWVDWRVTMLEDNWYMARLGKVAPKSHTPGLESKGWGTTPLQALLHAAYLTEWTEREEEARRKTREKRRVGA